MQKKVYDVEVVYRHIVSVKASSDEAARKAACEQAIQQDADETTTQIIRIYAPDPSLSYKVGDHFIGTGGELVITGVCRKLVFYHEVGDTSLEGSAMDRQKFDNAILAGTIHGQREETVIEKAMRLIDNFCVKEFQSHADFEALDRIPIGHTTITDDELPIQVYADLINFKIEQYICNVLVETCQYDSLERLIHFQLDGMDFSDLAWYTDEQINFALKQNK